MGELATGKGQPVSYQARVRAPFAVIGVRTEGDFLVRIDYLPQHNAPLDAADLFTGEVCRQLRAYLADPHFAFDLPVAAGGTLFQKRAWAAIGRIPCGQTLTYSDVAQRIASGPRAVGAACGANPVPLVVPCHRVVGRGGLGGFMNATGGFAIEVKRWLLAHERI